MNRIGRLLRNRLVQGLVVAGAVAGGIACSGGSSAESGESAETSASWSRLAEQDRADVVEKRATCPFVGTAVAMKLLEVQSQDVGTTGVKNFISNISGKGSVIELGDTGGGNLGSGVLKIFASGNHQRMFGPDGKFGQKVPNPSTMFSLQFPASQGSHPGHSGILQDNPNDTESGRFSPENFKRLLDHQTTVTFNDGSTARVLPRSEIGKFIAENLMADRASKVCGPSVFRKLSLDLLDVAATVGGALKEHVSNAANGTNNTAEEQKLYQIVTKLLGEDNLIGSSGEFGLLMAFLANSPNTVEVAWNGGPALIPNEPALSVDEVTMMFAGDGQDPMTRRFPEGWDKWKKTRYDWIMNTALLAYSAWHAYAELSGIPVTTGLNLCPEPVGGSSGGTQ